MSKKKRTAITFITLTSLACLTACDSKDISTALNDGISESTAVIETTEAVTTSAKTTKAATTTEITTEAVTQTEAAALQNKNEEISDSDYKSAYKKLIEDKGFNNEESAVYGLIHLNDDDIPELSVRIPCAICLYTYSDGKIYTLMDKWPFGAMGCNGYDYLPECNSIYYEDGDYAGAIRYHTYLSLDENFEFYVTDQYESHLFNDVNGNGVPDSNDEILDTPLYYIDDKEVTEQEIAEKRKGEYESIIGDMTLDELYLMLE